MNGRKVEIFWLFISDTPVAALHARTYRGERDNANEKTRSRESKIERNRERESKCHQARDQKKK